jgi:hypothetical protein
MVYAYLLEDIQFAILLILSECKKINNQPVGLTTEIMTRALCALADLLHPARPVNYGGPVGVRSPLSLPSVLGHILASLLPCSVHAPYTGCKCFS